MKRDFNLAAKILLGYSMLAMTANVFTNFINMSIEANSAMNIVEIVFSILIIIAGICTFMKLRFGIIALTILFLARFVITISLNEVYDMAYYIGMKLPYFIRDFGLFAIAMCFKKNGISGWKSMLASKGYLQSNTNLTDK